MMPFSLEGCDAPSRRVIPRAMPLPYTAPWLLAPMEGVTEPLFRGMVLGLHSPAALGGACTEFVRVSSAPLPRRVLRAHLGAQGPIPVALQLMGSDLQHLAVTAARAVEVGAPVLDLNFGCPAKGALRGCAGSALMDDPERLRELVTATCEAAAGRVPVTAKLRAGGDDDSRLEELVDAACAGGAALVTMHARTRAEAYSVDADWERLRRAADAARAHGVPVCGNGGVERHADLEALRRETGCAFAMVGRGALADPWIFSGHEASGAEAAGFLLAYGQGLEAQGASARGAAARVKQLLGHWRAGGLVPDEEARRRWLRERDPRALFARLEAWVPQKTRGAD
jgi:tRNA-dihydrouridine synthase C